MVTLQKAIQMLQEEFGRYQPQNEKSATKYRDLFLKKVDDQSFNNWEELFNFLNKAPLFAPQLKGIISEAICNIVGINYFHIAYLIPLYQTAHTSVTTVTYDNQIFTNEDCPSRESSKRAIMALIADTILTNKLSHELKTYLKTDPQVGEEHGKNLLMYFNQRLKQQVLRTKTNLYRQLNVMREHGAFLAEHKDDESKKTGAQVLVLNEQLHQYADKYFDEPQGNMTTLCQDFYKILHQYDDKMSMHRAQWKPILLNVLIALTVVGTVALLVNALHSRFSEGAFHFNSCLFFAKTNRQKNIAIADEKINDFYTASLNFSKAQV